MYQYKVEIDLYGGEFVVGEIPLSTCDYWIDRGPQDLESHLLLNEARDVPPEHHLHPWYEQGDLIHTYGPDFSGFSRITVTNLRDSAEKFCFNLDDDLIQENAWVINEREHPVSEYSGAITCATWEKGIWEYESIETEEPFALSKLEFFLYFIDETFIVDHLKYDGVKINHCDGTTHNVDFRFELECLISLNNLNSPKTTTDQ